MANDLLQRPDEDQDRRDQPGDVVTPSANELESLYDKPAITPDERNAGPDSNNDEVGELEDQFKQPMIQGRSRNTGSDNDDSLLNKVPGANALGGVSKIISIARNHKRKGVVGGVVGLVAALVFAAGLFLQGPLQFVHIAQLLDQFHFGSVESFSDERGTNLWRFARTPGFNPDSRRARRLGELGNKFANATEIRLNQQGISSNYDRIGNFDGYTIDPEVYEGGRYKGDPEGLRRKLASEGFDVNLSNDGLIRAPKQSGVFKSRRLIDFVSSEAGYGKVLSKLSARTLRIRGNVTFHPIRRANEWGKLQLTEWLDVFRQRVNNGDTGVRVRATDYGDEDSLDNSRSEDPEVRNRADASAEAVDLDRSSLESLKTKGLRAGGVATTVVAGTCVIYGISQNYDAISFENVNLPLMRFAMEFVTVGSQVQSGDDINLDDLKHLSTRLNDPETGANWSSAKSINYELGQQPPTGPDIPESARPAGGANPISNFIGSVPGVDGFCKVLSSKAGILAGLVLDIASGPVSAVIAVADEIGNFSDTFVNFLTNWIADDPVNVDTFVGPKAGNAFNYGARLAAREVLTGMGGREQSTAETAALDRNLAQQLAYEQQQLSFADRLFNLADANSFSSRLAFAIPNVSLKPSTVGYSTKSFLVSLMRSPFNTAGVLAADDSANYDYGFAEVGFSEEERNDPRFADPYENADLIFDKLPDLNDKYGPSGFDCFGVDVKPDGRVVQLGRDRLPQKPECLDDDEDLLRFRFYIADSVIAASGACFEGVDEACTDIGYESSSTNSNYSNPVDGLLSPPNLGQPDSNGYYQMPEATKDEYQLNTNGGSPRSEQCGSKQLVDVTYTILSKYQNKYGEALGVGDLNATGHASHRNGIDVDIYSHISGAPIPMADNEKAIQLAKWAYDTGVVELIGYNYSDQVIAEVNDYAGDGSFMRPWPGHQDHFHVRLKPEFKGPESVNCGF